MTSSRKMSPPRPSMALIIAFTMSFVPLTVPAPIP